jgi:hypothetical protein
MSRKEQRGAKRDRRRRKVQTVKEKRGAQKG